MPRSARRAWVIFTWPRSSRPSREIRTATPPTWSSARCISRSSSTSSPATGSAGSACCLTGQSFQHHFSAAVSLFRDPASPRFVVFDVDVADRCRAPGRRSWRRPTWSGSARASSSPPARTRSPGRDPRSADGRLELECDPPAGLALAEAGRSGNTRAGPRQDRPGRVDPPSPLSLALGQQRRDHRVGRVTAFDVQQLQRSGLAQVRPGDHVICPLPHREGGKGFAIKPIVAGLEPGSSRQVVADEGGRGLCTSTWS